MSRMTSSHLPPTLRSRRSSHFEQGIIVFISYATAIVCIIATVKGTCCINRPKQVKLASGGGKRCPCSSTILSGSSPVTHPMWANLASTFWFENFGFHFKHQLSWRELPYKAEEISAHKTIFAFIWDKQVLNNT